jgi:hypothetical protein
MKSELELVFELLKESTKRAERKEAFEFLSDNIRHAFMKHPDNAGVFASFLKKELIDCREVLKSDPYLNKK